MTFNPWIFFIYWTTGSFSLEELFLDLLDLEDRLGDLDFFDDLLSCRGDLDDLEFFDDLPGLGLGDLEDLLLLLLLLGDLLDVASGSSFFEAICSCLAFMLSDILGV